MWIVYRLLTSRHHPELYSNINYLGRGFVNTIILTGPYHTVTWRLNPAAETAPYFRK
jgi:hypothetical protein